MRGERHAAVDVEQARVPQQLAAAAPGSRPRPPPPAVASATTIARSRSTSGWRPTAGARSGVSRPSARPSIATSATITGVAGAELPGVDRRRVQLADEGVQPARDLGASRPSRVEHGLARLRPVGRTRRGPAGRRAARAGPSRRRGRTAARGGSRPAARPTPTSANAEPPPLPRLVACPRVALADLEHRDVLDAVAKVGARRRRAGCRAGSGAATEWSRESGFVDGDRRAAGLRLVADGRHRARAGRTTSRWRGDTSAVVTTSVRPAPASVSRTSSRTSSGEGRKAGIAVSGVTDGVELVAADAGDLLGDVRLDRRRRGARWARARRAWRVPRPVRRPAHRRSAARAAARPSPARRAPPRSRSRPGPGASRCSSADELGAQQAVDPRGPERDARRARARRARCRRVRGRPRRPPTRGRSCAVRSAPIRASRGSWPFSNRLLASERSASRWAVRRMLTGSKIADSIATSRRRVADLRCRAAHDAGDADRAVAVGDQQHVGGELALDVVQRLEPLPRPARDGRRSSARPSGPGWTAPASNVWIGLPSSSIT